MVGLNDLKKKGLPFDKPCNYIIYTYISSLPAGQVMMMMYVETIIHV